ncbi:uncharacterized protein BKCO1_900041 [Diplodia corticola]|uniref:Uncharacterized protein n=1 Tax=Diplodia corticola TaxID=236234 RepID=A0A1J9SBC1_9PEZI|nr:uncharacterized protein BKCO1_900041 [Diplodia corticola]OJD36885.1 hypothetical protein BKCO1_900041 [Diplodia corticola]
MKLSLRLLIVTITVLACFVLTSEGTNGGQGARDFGPPNMESFPADLAALEEAIGVKCGDVDMSGAGPNLQSLPLVLGMGAPNLDAALEIELARLDYEDFMATATLTNTGHSALDVLQPGLLLDPRNFIGKMQVKHEDGPYSKCNPSPFGS